MDFFSNIGEESLKSALKEHFGNEDEIAPADQNLANLSRLLGEFMESNNIVLHHQAQKGSPLTTFIRTTRGLSVLIS